MKLHTGDHVVIISGKDKGKTGSVLRVLKTNRVVVSDVNMRTKHIKAQPNRPGQIIRYEASIDASNVMLVDAKTKKRTRIGYKVDEKGKTRISKRSGEAVVAVKHKKEVKEAKEEKESKDVKAAKPTKETKKKDKKAERVDSPEKSPFWKKMGFGAEAIEEAGSSKEVPRMQQDHSVPHQGKTTDTFTHKRGE